MKIAFKKVMREVETKLDKLLAAKPFQLAKVPLYLPAKGIYLLCKGKRALYVGRSNGIGSRLRGHVADSHYSATFAFLLAREATGCLKATYKTKGSRTSLLKNRKFKSCFDSARNEIRKMKIRVVEETDPTKQALLEIYAAY